MIPARPDLASTYTCAEALNGEITPARCASTLDLPLCRPTAWVCLWRKLSGNICLIG